MIKLMLIQTAHNVHIGPLVSCDPIIIGAGLTIGRKGGGIRQREHSIRLCKCVVSGEFDLLTACRVGD
jgi:hypothetical protein